MLFPLNRITAAPNSRWALETWNHARVEGFNYHYLVVIGTIKIKLNIII
jgi:hypothetical protein